MLDAGSCGRLQLSLLVVSVVGVALEGVDVQVLVVVLFLLRCRFGRGGAAEQLESLKRNGAEQGNDNGDKGNLDCLRKFRETQRLFLGVIIGEALFARAFGVRRCGRGLSIRRQRQMCIRDRYSGARVAAYGSLR